MFKPIRLTKVETRDNTDMTLLLKLPNLLDSNNVENI